MQKTVKKRGIIKQVAIFFLAASLLIGVVTLFSQRSLYNKSVTTEMERLSLNISKDVSAAVTEFPSYEWLIQYWAENYDKLDIEYDSDFRPGTRTEEKVRLLAEHQPDFQPKYAAYGDAQMLPAEDKKLFAEIAYSWLITRLDQIKRSNKVDYLFGVLTQDPFSEQFFLFSAAEPNAKRGTNYEEVYPIGVRVTVSADQQEGMRAALQNNMHLAKAGNYVDYYYYVCTVGRSCLMVGLTFNLTEINANIASQTRIGSLNAVALQLTLAVFCLAMIFAFVLKPLKQVQESIRTYKADRNSERIRQELSAIESKNEIGQLSEDVIDLTKEIDEHVKEIAEITAEQEKTAAEMALAARIQSHALPTNFPPFPDRKEFDIYATMDPAKEVGGDFYDLFMIDDDHVALLIADVSGKGVPAALFMMVSMIVIHSLAEGQTSPAKVLEAVNERTSSRNPEEMFFSLWLGILEISSGKLTASNAGHEYPMVMHPGRGFEMLKDKHGLVIGGMSGIKYSEYDILLEPGSKVFVYTDGLPEATDPENNMFGMQRILEELNKDPDADIRQLIENVQKGVDSFVKDAEQFDDLTMMCLVYNGQQEADPAQEKKI